MSFNFNQRVNNNNPPVSAFGYTGFGTDQISQEITNTVDNPLTRDYLVFLLEIFRSTTSQGPNRDILDKTYNKTISILCNIIRENKRK